MPSEAETRRIIIDVRLKEAGWDVRDPSQILQEFSFAAPRLESSGSSPRIREDAFDVGSREFSDYVLLGENGKPVAVVEAKKSSKSLFLNEAAIWCGGEAKT